MNEQSKIKNRLVHSLKKLNAFWSYDAAIISAKNINNEMLIEKSLVHLDIDDLKKLFSIFPYKKIREVWKTQLCTQEPYYHSLNTMLALLFFNIKKPEKYLKTINNQQNTLLKKRADEWFSNTYGEDF